MLLPTFLDAPTPMDDSFPPAGSASAGTVIAERRRYSIVVLMFGGLCIGLSVLLRGG